VFHIEHGQHDATADVDNMHGTISDPRSGKPMRRVLVIRGLAPDGQRMEMHFKPDAMPQIKALEARDTRA